MTDGMTDAEKLAAIETYMRMLKTIADTLRSSVTDDLGRRHVERVGAYLPGGVKLASVSHSEGKMSAAVKDEAAALRWCIERYPDEVQTVQVIRPAFLKSLLDAAKADGAPDGAPGVDPRTGELLSFIEVARGSAYVTVTTTEVGRSRMAALAAGFTAALEAAPYRVIRDTHDGDFADRLENGGRR